MDYAIAAGKAASKLKDAGQLLDFFKASQTPADVGLPWRGPNTDTIKASASAVILPPSAGSELGASILDAELLSRMSFMLIVAPFPDAESFQYVKIDENLYQIKRIETLRPTNIAIMHFMWVAR